MNIFGASKCIRKLRVIFLGVLVFSFMLYYYNVKKANKRKKFKKAKTLQQLREIRSTTSNVAAVESSKFLYPEFVVSNATNNLPERFKSDLLNHFDINKCLISKILHQTWKTDKVQTMYKNYILSWLKKNKDWSYSFTTNELNRKFMEKKFPEFLDIYDNYKSEIQRADAIRYFLLYEYGGVYADIDFEALKSMNTFIDEFGHSKDGIKNGCIIGQEPFEHAHILYNKKRLICNAIMISCAKHPFWLLVFQELMLRKNIKTVRATGPKMLSAALDKYEELRRRNKKYTTMNKRNDIDNTKTINLPFVYIPSPYVFYPNFDDANLNHRKNCKIKGRRNISKNREIACEKLENTNYQNDPERIKSAVAVHHWAHTWHRPNMVEYGQLHSINDICNNSEVVWNNKNDMDGRIGSRRINLLN
jgi:inositol phosphorylceramide mannosyltransferase catalytic subunit